MKQLTLTLIIGILIFIGCEDKKSSSQDEDLVPVFGCTDSNAVNYNPDAIADNDSCEYSQIEEVTTHDIDAAGAPGFYYNFSSGTEVDSSSSWHISFQMISVVFGQSTYMMPSLVLGGAVYAAEYSNVTFNALEETPGTFMSDYFQDASVVQYSGSSEVLQYDMQSHTVSVKNPDRVFVIYESTNHTTYKIQFVEYLSGVILFRYSAL